MTKTIFAACALFLLTAFASAQNIPSFARYKVKVGSKSSKQPNLASHENARMYRTNLRNAAKTGVNYAGHFVIATWGCGTGCTSSALIDARTGKVFFPDILQGVGAGFCELPDNSETLAYQPDSRLLILSGFKGNARNGANGNCGIYYLEWTGTTFRQIKFIAKNALI